MEASAGSPAPRLFRSRYHPGEAGLLATFLRAYTRPLPYTLLPLMVSALAVALQEGDVSPFLLLFFPLAFVGTGLWVAFGLSRRLAEVIVTPNGSCLRSVWDVARDVPCRWHAVHGLRYNLPWITFAWNRASVELNETEWPEAPLLLDALRQVNLDRRAHEAQYS